MTVIERILAYARAAALGALDGFTCWPLLRGACRRIRFRCGKVTAERDPLSLEEVRALQAIREGCRFWTPEPVYLDREDRT